jgi:hypothetical protein
MKLYLAGGEQQTDMFEAVAEASGVKRFLKSFAYSSSRKTADRLVDSDRPDLDILVDSGAYTAWKEGTPIVLSDYIRFSHSLKRKAKCTLNFIALDIIPGKADRKQPTEQEFAEASQQGWDNYVAMKNAGIDCLPTFHQGDPWYWLEKMAHETTYIALSPRKVGKTPKQKMLWLSECFRKIDKWGLLFKLKTHGLGVASPVFMRAYPFYSVDTTSWFQAGRSSVYFSFNGMNVESLPPNEWGRNADRAYRNPRTGRAKMDNISGVLCAIDRYQKPRGNHTRTLEAGYPWLMKRSMVVHAQLENFITELWLGRGVNWDHDWSAPIEPDYSRR